MEKFIVSARKYRPQHFNTVVGQSHITTTLKNAIQHNQLAHAFLFCGPRGVGKTTCARILAKTINCTSRTEDGEACDQCNSCLSFNEGTSLNIHELDAASNNSVDDIRTLVDQVRFAPQAGDYKVYIIDEVHMLTSSAFNAFLKTLEEPPAHAKFILATTEKHKILPTILSRCQIFDFKRITLNDTVAHLEEICTKEAITAEKAALQVIAQKSEGCMRDALSIMDKIVSFTNGELNYKNTLEHLNILDEEYFFKFLDYFISQDLPAALLLHDEINKKGFEGDTLLLGLSEFFRNLLVCKDEKTAHLLEAIENFRKKYISSSKTVEANWLISALNILTTAEIDYKQSRNKKLHVELVLIKLCYLNQALEASIVGHPGTFKKKSNEPISFKLKSIKSLVGLLKQKPIETIPTNSIIIENEPEHPIKEITPTPYSNIEKDHKKNTDFKALKNIRQQVAEAKQNKEAKTAKEFLIDALQYQWKKIAEKLNADGNNQSTQSVLELAQLQIVKDHSFTITVNSNVQLKVIEQNKKTIMEELVNYFHLKDIQFSIIVEHLEEFAGNEGEQYLNKKQQYLNIIEANPFVKELKDRLGLELDY